MRILLTVLIVLLILSLLGTMPLYLHGQEPAMQRPREGGTFGIILNDRVYSLTTPSPMVTKRVTPYYPEYSPWQRYDSYRQLNRYDFERSYWPQRHYYRSWRGNWSRFYW